MTLQQLEYVLALAQHGHFAKAAESCGITQPTLSAMVQKLEDELGVRLFARGRQPIVPTPAGRAVVAHARRVLADVRCLRNAVWEARHSLRGPFRLGVLPTIAPYLIPRFFPQLCAAHPEAELSVVEMKTGEMAKALRQGELEAGILARVEGLDDFACHTLYYERFLAYVSEGSRLSAHASVRSSDLQGERLWLLDEGHCFRDQLVRYCQLKGAGESRQAYRLGSIETFMRIVEGGLGVTFIPELALDQLSEPQRRLVRPFALPSPTREIVLATAGDFIRKAWLDELLTAICGCVPPTMGRLETQRCVLLTT